MVARCSPVHNPNIYIDFVLRAAVAIWASWSHQLDKCVLMVLLDDKQAAGGAAGAQNSFENKF
jgi:hypothetical protein